VVDEVHGLVDLVVARDVEHLEPEVLAPDVLDVVERPRLEVVDADHPVPASEQVITEMRAEEAGAARYQRGWHPLGRVHAPGPSGTRRVRA
jgi:hypothetical protein